MGFFKWMQNTGALAGLAVHIAKRAAERDHIGILRAIATYYKHQGGRMLRLAIESENKQLMVEVQFPDDPSPLKLSAKYVLERNPNEERIRLYDVATSKQSYNVLLKLAPQGGFTFVLPPEYADVIKLLL